MEGDTDLQQRRERGRMAQRAFRQRQISTIRELRDKNQALVEAIQRLTEAATLFSRGEGQSNREKIVLDTAIQDARNLADLTPLEHHGIDSGDSVVQVESPRQSIKSQPTRTRRNPASSIVSTYDSDTESPPSMTISSPDNMVRTENIDSANYNTEVRIPNQENYDAPNNYFTSQETIPTITSTSRSGRVSPRLTYGLWFEPDRFIRVVNPPEDIVPYLGENTNTLAGAIFWAGIGYGFNFLKAALRMRTIQSSSSSSSTLAWQFPASNNTIPPPPGPKPDPTFTVTRLFGRAIRAAGNNVDGTKILHDLIDARFTWRKHGYIPADHPAVNHSDAPTRLFSEIVKGMMAPWGVDDTAAASNDIEGPDDLRLWMTPLEVEGYVRARLGAATMSVGLSSWEEVLRGQGQGQADNQLRAGMLRRLVRGIAGRGMCFGDSPRWRVDVAVGVVDEWMREVEAWETGLLLGGGGFWGQYGSGGSSSSSSWYGDGEGGFGAGMGVGTVEGMVF